ncbi:MAG: hypothetical protein IPK21_19105 [Haliscomenobacter sp.]|nr:hypothetical protein [Haliscomenobacter sp.]
MNKLLLSFIRHLAPFWRGLGVDPNHLQTILEIKLKMDARRRSPFSYGRSAKSSNGDLKAQDLLTMFFTCSPEGCLFCSTPIWIIRPRRLPCFSPAG